MAASPGTRCAGSIPRYPVPVALTTAAASPALPPRGCHWRRSGPSPGEGRFSGGSPGLRWGQPPGAPGGKRPPVIPASRRRSPPPRSPGAATLGRLAPAPAAAADAGGSGCIPLPGPEEGAAMPHFLDWFVPVYLMISILILVGFGACIYYFEPGLQEAHKWRTQRPIMERDLRKTLMIRDNLAFGVPEV
ncbi:translation initiation factor IF-2-like [Cygnus olor]|uniref:translation initiation factor IF-2-like n=1 Tax=Cygnus olor TaxID=8869 RepID=UPI001ADE15DD|nr:translation initiation factor IF-2-like [Cygnus olor]